MDIITPNEAHAGPSTTLSPDRRKTRVITPAQTKKDVPKNFVHLSANMKNNNPGNLEKSGINWDGEINGKGRFVSFDTPLSGARASARNLHTYIHKHKLDTIAEIIDRWAPSNENDTALYIKQVSEWTGIPAKASIAGDSAKQAKVLQAIFRKETGKKFPMNFILHAMRAAGSIKI